MPNKMLFISVCNNMSNNRPWSCYTFFPVFVCNFDIKSECYKFHNDICNISFTTEIIKFNWSLNLTQFITKRQKYMRSTFYHFNNRQLMKQCNINSLNTCMDTCNPRNVLLFIFIFIFIFLFFVFVFYCSRYLCFYTMLCFFVFVFSFFSFFSFLIIYE